MLPLRSSVNYPKIGEMTPEPESLSEENMKLVPNEEKKIKHSERKKTSSIRFMRSYLAKKDSEYTKTDLMNAMRAMMKIAVYKGGFLLMKSEQIDNALQKIGFSIAVHENETLGNYYHFDKKDMKILFEQLLNPSIRNLTPKAIAEITSFATMLTVRMKIFELLSCKGMKEEFYQLKLTEMQVEILRKNMITFSGGTKTNNEFRLQKSDLMFLHNQIIGKLTNNLIVPDSKTIESIRTDKQIRKTIDEIGSGIDTSICSCCMVCGYVSCCCFVSAFLCITVC